MKTEVAFFIESAAIFERFLLIFQKDEPLIHILFEEVMELTANVLGRVCKPDLMLDLNNVNSHFISSNLLVERYNRTIKAMISKIMHEEGKNWNESLNKVQFASNNTYNRSIKNTPSILYLG